MEGYTSLNMGQTNFLTVKNGVGTITNISDDPPTYGDLIVQKNVLNKDGTDTLTDADKSRTFLFTVTLTDSQGGGTDGQHGSEYRQDFQRHRNREHDGL